LDFRRALDPFAPISELPGRKSRKLKPEFDPRRANGSNKSFRGVGFRGGLVFKADRLVYHSTLGLRVITKKKKKKERAARTTPDCWMG